MASYDDFLGEMILSIALVDVRPGFALERLKLLATDAALPRTSGLRGASQEPVLEILHQAGDSPATLPVRFRLVIWDLHETAAWADVGPPDAIWFGAVAPGQHGEETRQAWQTLQAGLAAGTSEDIPVVIQIDAAGYPQDTLVKRLGALLSTGTDYVVVEPDTAEGLRETLRAVLQAVLDPFISGRRRIQGVRPNRIPRLIQDVFR